MHFQILIYFAIIIFTMPLVGAHLHKVFTKQKHILSKFEPFEHFIYKHAKIKHKIDQNWKEYAASMLIFNFLGIIFLFLILKFQQFLPLNPENFPGLSADLALNIAVSFTSNTNWQSYIPETTISQFSQIFGLTLQNFLSSATGLALSVALMRALLRQNTELIGNFYVDLTKSILYIILPIAIIFACLNVASGMPQNLKASLKIETLEGKQQTIITGPVASQASIKQVGTNGGAAFEANGSHPFENPTPISNLIQIIAMLLLPCAITYFFGKMSKEPAQSWILLTIMFGLIFITFSLIIEAESMNYNNIIRHSCGEIINMEGKEQRFNLADTSFWAAASTTISAGSCNATYTSFTSFGILILMLNMVLSEVIFGGVGSGLYGALIYIIITSFVASMMVGKQPEYLGKKITASEIKLATITIFIIPLTAIFFSALTIFLEMHGFIELESNNQNSIRKLIEVTYNFISTSSNNGSSLSSLNTNTTYFNITTAITIFIGRFLFAIPILAIAGKLAQKTVNRNPNRLLIAQGFHFGLMLISLIVIISGLTFLPIITIGPILEYILELRNNSL